MGMLGRALVRALKRAENELRDEEKPTEECISPSPSSSLRKYGQELNMSVVAARGGRIVHFSTYDSPKDKSISSTYIISDEEDFAESIQKLIVMEVMKQ